jgi:hypothetical protein
MSYQKAFEEIADQAGAGSSYRQVGRLGLLAKAARELDAKRWVPVYHDSLPGSVLGSGAGTAIVAISEGTVRVLADRYDLDVSASLEPTMRPKAPTSDLYEGYVAQAVLEGRIPSGVYEVVATLRLYHDPDDPAVGWRGHSEWELSRLSVVGLADNQTLAEALTECDGWETYTY